MDQRRRAEEPPRPVPFRLPIQLQLTSHTHALTRSHAHANISPSLGILQQNMRSSLLLLTLCFASASALTLRDSKSLEAAPTRSFPKARGSMHVEAKESFSRDPSKAVEGDDMAKLKEGPAV